MATELWDELVEKVKEGFEKSVEQIKTRDVENIPGAKDQLVRRFEELVRFLPQDHGKLLVRSIDESIANSFFPRTDRLAEAFQKILKARTHEQDFIINELINGFIASQTKNFASSKQGPMVDKLVEAFRTTRNFRITDYKFYAMFGDPDKPRKSVKEELDKIADFLGLIKEEFVIERDLKKSEEKTITYLTFPEEIRTLLEGSYINTTEKGETIINEDFDKNVFICTFLAHYAIDRENLDGYKINGICAIFALILILSFMPKVKLQENNPVLSDPTFNPDMMSVIPKSWMNKEVLTELLPPMIEVIAYRLGASKWYDKIEKSDAQRRLHLQTRFLLKDVNRWILGNMCRVEVPIFVEISNIFQDVTVGTDSNANEE